MITRVLPCIGWGVIVITDMLLGVGCGSDGTTPTTAKVITRAIGLQYARTVNLRADDVPGTTSIAKETATNRAIFGSDVERCGGIEAPGPIVGVNSARYRTVEGRHQEPLRSEAVYSSVYVVGNNTTASGDVTILGKAQFRSCLARYRASEAAGQSTRGEPFKKQIKVSVLPSIVDNVKGFGLRVSGTLAATYTQSKTRRPFFEDILGFAVGPAVIVLRAEGTPRPVPLSLERRLLSLLHARATTHGA